jgi:hypothetical protein
MKSVRKVRMGTERMTMMMTMMGTTKTKRTTMTTTKRKRIGLLRMKERT